MPDQPCCRDQDPVPKLVAALKPAVLAVIVNGDRLAAGCVVAPGLALTVAHTFRDRQDCVVYYADGSYDRGEVSFLDAANDLALVRLGQPPPGLTPVPLGRQERVLVGQSVFCIGHAHGYLFTVTRGCVSYLGRDIELVDGQRISDVLQTDVAANRGTSGAPLLNLYGELVGVVIAVRTGAENIAFAVQLPRLRSFLAAAGLPL